MQYINGYNRLRQTSTALRNLLQALLYASNNSCLHIGCQEVIDMTATFDLQQNVALAQIHRGKFAGTAYEILFLLYQTPIIVSRWSSKNI